MTSNPDNQSTDNTADAEEQAFEAAASFAQQRLWFLDRLAPGNSNYNINYALEIDGALQIDLLTSALNILTERHESLRTTFDVVDGEPLQVVSEQQTASVTHHDCSNLDDQALKEKLSALAYEPFDLRRGPLFRTHLLQRSADSSILLLVIHHIIADAWSLQIIYKELAVAYQALQQGKTPDLPDLELQYADFAEWQQEWLADTGLEDQLEYWRQQLRDAPERLEISTDKPRPRILGSAGATLSAELDEQHSQAIKALAQSHSVTLNNLMLAAFEALLGRLSGSDDFVIGTPIAGRERPELQDIIGFFVNTIALRADLADDPGFMDLVKQVSTAGTEALANDDLPFDKLVEELQPTRDPSYSPIFQVMFVLQHGGGKEGYFADLKARALSVDAQTAKFDLTLFVTDVDRALLFALEYNTDLFEAQTIERILAQFSTLLRTIAANPEARLSELNLLSDGERAQVLEDFNATDTDFGTPVCVNQLVEQQTEATPDKTAVVFGDDALSYAELNQRANALAAHLGSLGAGPGQIVAVSLERSLELPVALLAVLKSGACYVPVDPNYPDERVSAMLDDSAATVIVTSAGIELPEHNAQTVLINDFDFTAVADNPAPGNPDNPLYCIYTSGSTGRPKGVQLSHAGLANLLQWQMNHERLGTPARTLQFASFSFDVHFQEFFGSWSSGATVVMVDEELRQDLPRLATFIDEQRIERLYLPYAALQPIAETLVANDAQPALRDVIVAGEQLQVSPAVRALFATLDGAALHNQYGPSEAHVVTALTLSGDENSWPDLPTIGYPVANTRCYILDEAGNPCPVGIPGELYLAGIQVGSGYLNRPELNAEKFLASPFVDGERMYRTGDRARFLADGQIEFLGRADDQVKWRGFRIEPGEIEARLTAQPSVQQAIVLLREDNPGNPQLVAYVTGDNPDGGELRQALKATLPDYMVPGVIVTLDELPLTPSGKVARRRLPVPEYSRDDANPYVAPTNPVEEQLCAIWQDVLGLEQVGIRDDFFALGGHSLLATQLVSRVRDVFAIDLPLKLIFRHSTAESLAEAMDTIKMSQDLQATTANYGDDDDETEEFSI